MSEEQEIRYAYRLCPCPAYDVEGMESWLTDMASQGLMLAPDGFFCGIASFERSEPRTVRYRLRGAKNSTSMWAENGGDPDPEAIAIGADMGWEYIAKRDGFTIWRTGDPGIRELNTDPAVQALALKAVRRRQWDNGLEILFWAVLWPAFAVRGSWLLTMLSMGSPLFLFGTALIVWALADCIRSLVHLHRLAARLRQGEELSHRADWKKQAAPYRIGRIVQIVCITVWVLLTLHTFLMSAAREDELPLSEFSGTVPFATMADFAPGGEYTLGGYTPANTVTIRSDLLAPVSIDWHEQAEILLPDGRKLDGGLSVFYHEAANEAIAARLVKEYHNRDRKEKHYSDLPLSLEGMDYAAAYTNHLHFPTVLLRKGNVVMRAYFYQVGKEDLLTLEEWAAILADRLA